VLGGTGVKVGVGVAVLGGTGVKVGVGVAVLAGIGVSPIGIKFGVLVGVAV
jgi:hypothetical protein